MSYPQQRSYVVAMQLFLSGTDTPATGKTVTVQVAKISGGALGSPANPNAGASTATEVSAVNMPGWYYFNAAAADFSALGDTVWQFSEASIDTAYRVYPTFKNTNLGAEALPDAAANTIGGLKAFVLAAGLAQSGSNAAVLVLQTALSVNNLARRAYVEIIAGTGAGQTASIASHTTTSITFDRSLTTALDTTSQYNVVYGNAPQTNSSGGVAIDWSQIANQTATVNFPNTTVGIVTSVTNGTKAYETGAVWLDTAGANAGSTAFIDGLPTNPVNTIARALTVLTATGLKKLHCESGNTITLGAAFPYHLVGDNVAINLNGQDISNAIFENFGALSGTGLMATGQAIFNQGPVGNVTLPGCIILNCGFTGTLTAPAAGGNYVIRECITQGSTVPAFNFGSVSSTTKVDCRNYTGGATWTFNTFCTATIECANSGVQTVTNGGGNVNIYGNIRSIVLTVSGTATVNIHGIVGSISISGSASAVTINITGEYGAITDTSTGTTVNKLGMLGTNLDAQISLISSAVSTILTTVSSIATSVGTIVTKMGGISFFKNWFALIMGKTADSATKAEVNATTAGATYDNTLKSLEAHVDGGGGGGGGSGAFSITITIRDSSTSALIPNASIAAYSGASVVATGTTDVNGQVVFALNAGTYTVTAVAAQYNGGSNSLVVTAGASVTYTLVRISITPPAPGQGTGYATTYTTDGITVRPNVSFSLIMVKVPTSSTGAIIDGQTPETFTSDGSGLLTVNPLLPTATYTLTEADTGRQFTFVAQSGTFAINSGIL